MKGLPWILAGIGVGIAVTFLLFVDLSDQPEPAYDIGYDGFTDAARKTFAWGTRKQAEGKVGSFAGAIKQGAGKLIGNQNMVAEGAADRVIGNVKDAAGHVGEAVGQTLHDLNQ
ncbi:CsbD family protein [Tunturibacter empetritectus]|uniref:Uncharacterized protein YjbJ (UPF0337 family) n=1 Tax=Tunturiibacter lichenicola TaxID=2051959 RepID=A0A7W8J8L1_9BACT|nr:CsbD family protein [Edaphobacter lichenicola]MBB5344590.1 uncharacterized protein YjbJ (UPF0337 family) [Edaphobacter lichenicola]